MPRFFNSIRQFVADFTTAEEQIDIPLQPHSPFQRRSRQSAGADLTARFVAPVALPSLPSQFFTAERPRHFDHGYESLTRVIYGCSLRYGFFLFLKEQTLPMFLEQLVSEGEMSAEEFGRLQETSFQITFQTGGCDSVRDEAEDGQHPPPGWNAVSVYIMGKLWRKYGVPEANVRRMERTTVRDGFILPESNEEEREEGEGRQMGEGGESSERLVGDGQAG